MLSPNKRKDTDQSNQIWFIEKIFLSSRWRLHTGIEPGGVLKASKDSEEQVGLIEGTRTGVLDRTKKGHRKLQERKRGKEMVESTVSLTFKLGDGSVCAVDNKA
ncbi:hypothetical protein OIU85_018562 [Salix viminalis]|uniref:Uncharacterized protein n=1 Tax=Salix viminalis TaxID=40686 RepID=A0A9Q0UV75_SALVM|nr:hypothetical protein OIU85_018562 [Salix viminalis]